MSDLPMLPLEKFGKIKRYFLYRRVKVTVEKQQARAA